MTWHLSYRADPAVRVLADRHYNRQAVGAVQFVPPGRCLVLKTPDANAFWISSWPEAQYVQHAWAGAWINTAFRNEAPECYLSSDLVRDAISATRWLWKPPPLGMVTFIDPDKIRRKRDPGRCFRKAGFRPCGSTKGGLLALQLLPDAMPAAAPPIGAQIRLLVP